MRIPVPPSVVAPVASAALFLALASHALAQQPPAWDWPDKAKNLKVLPKTTSKEELRGAMMAFTRSLGVRCN